MIKKKKLNLAKLKDIFLTIFKIKNNLYGPKLSRANFKDWDSMSHLNLLMALEKIFNIKFTHREFNNLTSIEKIKKSIEKKYNKKEFKL